MARPVAAPVRDLRVTDRASSGRSGLSAASGSRPACGTDRARGRSGLQWLQVRDLRAEQIERRQRIQALQRLQVRDLRVEQIERRQGVQALQRLQVRNLRVGQIELRQGVQALQRLQVRDLRAGQIEPEGVQALQWLQVRDSVLDRSSDVSAFRPFSGSRFATSVEDR